MAEGWFTRWWEIFGESRKKPCTVFEPFEPSVQYKTGDKVFVEETGKVETIINPDDLAGAFAVPDNAPWWLAVHAVIDELEQEWIRGARESVANTNVCINALGISEGVAAVRRRLIETRDEVLRSKRVA